MSAQGAAPALPASILWLALGSFAVGTEAFMIAGVLPTIGRDLAVTPAMTGQLVPAFEFTFAISAPILATWLARCPRRRLLLLSLLGFAAINFGASLAPGFGTLVAARMLLALAAGLYIPTAVALAGALAAPERRGRALAAVHGGITLSIALGAPVGALVAERFGWRSTFTGVALLAAAVAAGLAAQLPRQLPTPRVPTMPERLAAVRDARVLRDVCVTTIWAAGVWAIYAYLGLFAEQVIGAGSRIITLILVVYGICGMIGVTLGGRAIDLFGSKKVLLFSTGALALVYLGLTVLAGRMHGPAALWPMLGLMVAWGLAGFMFNPAQQAYLIRIRGIEVAPVTLSLNASFVHFGFALGTELGALVVAHDSVTRLGLWGCAGEVLALLLILLNHRSLAPVTPSASPSAPVPRPAARNRP
jgi:predicted MFS family arabinose efflux permease